jgi:hypothetical protein
VVDLREVDCGQARCEEYVSLTFAELDCFWDSVANDWSSATPALIADQCSHTGAACELLVNPVAFMELDSTCGCLDACMADTGGVQQECCVWRTPEDSDADFETWDYPEDVIKEAIILNCDPLIVPTGELPTYCGPEDIPEPVLGDPCPEDSIIAAPGADFLLQADREDSYVSLTTPQDSMLVPVGGSGAAQASPAAFLTAFFWADDAEFAGHELSDWTFAFAHPIELYTGSGTFQVPASETNQATIRGTGFSDDDAMKLLVQTNTNASGTLNSSTGRWTLNFSQTTSLGQIQVHLEGPFEATEW